MNPQDADRAINAHFDEKSANRGALEAILRPIRATILADLRPVRPLPPERFFLLGVLLVFAAIVGAGCGLIGMRGWAALDAVQKIAVFTPLIASSMLLAIAAVRGMAPGRANVRSLAIAAGAAFAVLIGSIAVVFAPHLERHFVAHGLTCLTTGLEFSIPTAVVFAAIFSRGAMLSPALAGAASGGLAGLVGLTVLEFHCPNLNQEHILVWHIAVVLISACAGLAAGRLVMAVDVAFRESRA